MTILGPGPRAFFLVVLLVWGGLPGLLAAEPRIVSATVKVAERDGRTWNDLEGEVELFVELPSDALWPVIEDWTAYPRLFPKIREVKVTQANGEVLLSEVVAVSALGVEAINRFTLRIHLPAEASPTRLTWTQEAVDRTIDMLSGGWTLTPETRGGRSGTILRYQTKSSVVQSVPGQHLVVGLAFPGELKQIIQAVADEAQKRKRQP